MKTLIFLPAFHWEFPAQLHHIPWSLKILVRRRTFRLGGHTCQPSVCADTLPGQTNYRRTGLDDTGPKDNLVLQIDAAADLTFNIRTTFHLLAVWVVRQVGHDLTVAKLERMCALLELTIKAT